MGSLVIDPPIPTGPCPLSPSCQEVWAHLPELARFCSRFRHQAKGIVVEDVKPATKPKPTRHTKAVAKPEAHDPKRNIPYRPANRRGPA